MHTAKDYLRNHRRSGLKVGDRVKVIRKAVDWDFGWQNTWVSPEMDIVGKTRKIVSDDGEQGFTLEVTDTLYPPSYPFFVLQKVSSRKTKSKVKKKKTIRAKKPDFLHD